MYQKIMCPRVELETWEMHHFELARWFCQGSLGEENLQNKSFSHVDFMYVYACIWDLLEWLTQDVVQLIH